MHLSRPVFTSLRWAQHWCVAHTLSGDLSKGIPGPDLTQARKDMVRAL